MDTEIVSANPNHISIPGRHAFISRKLGKPVVALSLWILVGVGLLTGLMTLTLNASAQATSRGDVPPLSGSPASPDCGSDWSQVSSPNASPSGNYLNGVAAISSGNAWAVGYYVTANSRVKTEIEHWGGTTWSVVPSPNMGTVDDELNGVTAISANNVWAVGLYHSSYMQRTLVEHWDGNTWGIISSPNPGTDINVLNGVTAISANNVWAVGYSCNAYAPWRTLVEHWNGTAWTVVASPNVGTNDNSLTGVAVVSSNDIWAVGAYNIDYALIEHWNGSAWSIVSSPNPARKVLSAVSAASADDVWAAGYRTSPFSTLIEHWDGSAWTMVPSPHVSNQDYLTGVTAISSNNAWAVGFNYLEPYQALIEHWNGNAWSVASSPIVGQESRLYGVAAISAGDIWAVGYGVPSSAAETLIERYNPCPPTSTPTPIPLPTQCAIQFEDVPNPSTFYPYIQCLSCRGIVSGYACGGANEPCDPNNDPYFRPHNDISRGQLAKIVALASQINTSVSGQTYEDVPPGSAFYTYTEQLHALGAMGGYACGGTNEPCIPPLNRPYFRPHAYATRGQIAKIDSKTAGYTDTPSGRQFEDVAVGSTFYTYTYRLVTRSIMGGYACGGSGEPCVPPANLPYFRSNNDVTRGQTSKIVANTYYPNCQAP